MASTLTQIAQQKTALEQDFLSRKSVAWLQNRIKNLKSPMALAKEIDEMPTSASACAAFASAIEAVKARGKSELGQKTMLDVLIPVHGIWVADGGVGLALAAKAAADAMTLGIRLSPLPQSRQQDHGQTQETVLETPRSTQASPPSQVRV